MKERYGSTRALLARRRAIGDGRRPRISRLLWKCARLYGFRSVHGIELWSPDRLWFAKTSQRQTRPQPHGLRRLCWTMVVRIIQIARLLTILASRHRSLVFENLALRQQLAVYRRTCPKPTVRWFDRLFWVGLRQAWPDWTSALVIIRAATVIAWHRRGFAWYWTRRSRPRGGRPQVGGDVRRLAREMARANPVHGELLIPSVFRNSPMPTRDLRASPPLISRASTKSPS